MKKIIATLAIFSSFLTLNAQEKLTLSDAIQRGLSQSFGIEIAKNTTLIAETRNTWGAAGAYPTLNFIASSDVSTAFDNSTSINSQFKLTSNWTAFNGFLIKTTKSLLDNNEELTKGIEMLQIETSIKSIIGSYYYVLMTRKAVEISEEVYKLSSDRYSQIKDAVDLGSKGTYQLIQAETALLEDEANLTKAKLAYENSLIGLNKVMSEAEPSKQWTISEDLHLPSNNYALATMQDKMLSNNTTLKNQYINQKARDLEIKQARSGYYPSLNINASAGEVMNGISKQNSGYSSNNYFGVNAGVTLSYAIFNNGKTRRNIAIAEINKTIENTATEEMKLVLTNSLYSLYNQFNQYSKLVDISNRQMTASKKNLEMSTERYKTGVINSFNYRDVQLSYMYDSLNRLQNIYDLMMLDLELLQITGGILNEYNG